MWSPSHHQTQQVGRVHGQDVFPPMLLLLALDTSARNQVRNAQSHHLASTQWPSDIQLEPLPSATLFVQYLPTIDELRPVSGRVPALFAPLQPPWADILGRLRL